MCGSDSLTKESGFLKAEDSENLCIMSYRAIKRIKSDKRQSEKR